MELGLKKGAKDALIEVGKKLSKQGGMLQQISNITGLSMKVGQWPTARTAKNKQRRPT